MMQHWIHHLVYMMMKWLPRSLRYFIMRRRIHVRDQVPENVIFKIADQEGEIRQALSILHDAYVEVGLMTPHETQMRVTKYHQMPTSVILIAKHKDEVIGTVTIVRDSKIGLPIDQLMNISELRQKNKGAISDIAEISALAIKPKWRGRIFYLLLKYLYRTSLYDLHIHHFIAVTHSKWYEFYVGALLFEELKSEMVEGYAFGNNLPVKPLHMDLRKGYIEFHKMYGDAPDHRNLIKLFDTPMDSKTAPQNHQYFSLLNPCHRLPLLQSEEENKLVRDPLKNRYPSFFRALLKTEQGEEWTAQVLNFSKEGIKLQLNPDQPTDFERTLNQYLKLQEPLQLTVVLGPFKISELKIIPKWTREKEEWGAAIAVPDRHWEEYVEDQYGGGQLAS